MLNLKSIGIGFLCLLAFKTNAQQTETTAKTEYSLKQAVMYALAHHPSIENSQKDVQLSEAKVKEITAIGLPQLNGSGSFMQYAKIPVQVVPNFTNAFVPPGQPKGPEFLEIAFAQKYTMTANIQLTQLLLDGSYLVGLQASHQVVELTQLAANRTAVEIENNVSKAYLLALMMQENVKLIETNLESVNKTLAQVSAINQQGLNEKLDVDRLQLTKSNLEIAKSRLIMQADLTLKLLKFNMGLKVDDPISLTDNLEGLMKNGFSDINETTGFDITNRIEKRLIDKQLQLSLLDEKRYKYGYLPSLALFANEQVATYRNKFNFFESNLAPNYRFIPSTYWGLSLQVPIFDGLKKQAQIEQVRLNREKTQNDLRLFENAAALEVDQAKIKYISNKALLDQQLKNKELANTIYTTTLKKFEAGVGSSFEFTQAETEFKTSQINYLTAVYDLLVAQLELKKALGK